MLKLILPLPSNTTFPIFYLNTSHVKVNLPVEEEINIDQFNRESDAIQEVRESYLNTSHVKVNPPMEDLIPPRT